MKSMFLIAQQPEAVAAAGVSMAAFLFSLIVAVFFIIVMWRVFTKAGQPGWGAIIPIYNIIIMLRIAGKPGWWIFFLLIPVINIVVQIVMLIDTAKNFGRGGWFAAGLIFFPDIFFSILVFGQSVYVGAGE